MLQTDTPIRMADLGEELYISRSTLKSDLKKVRAFLDTYDLQIDYRSYAGMSVIGSEKNLRRCLAKIEQNLIANDGTFLSEDTARSAVSYRIMFWYSGCFKTRPMRN